MTSSRLVLLLALQIGSVISFAPSPLDPNPNTLKQSTAAVGIEWEQAPPMAKKEPRFEQNTKLMYDGISDAMPWFIRKMVQKNMNNAIDELCEDAVVTENDMYAIIVKITPASNLQDSIDILDKHKTAHAHAVPQSVTNAVSATFLIAEQDFHFEQNSKLMYDNILASIPGFIRKVFENNMNNAIVDLCEETVTELDMYDVVTQITPKHFLQNSINVLDQYKTHAVFEEEHPASFFMIAENEVCFEQNSKMMYDKILEGHPGFVRQVVKNNLDKVITGMCGGVMTENDMYEVINTASPKPLLKFNLIILDEHKTS